MLCFQSNSSHVKKEKEIEEAEKSNKGVYNYNVTETNTNKHVRFPKMCSKFHNSLRNTKEHNGLVFNNNKKVPETIKQIKYFLNYQSLKVVKMLMVNL